MSDFNLLDEFSTWVETALSDYAQGEDVQYAVNLAVVPTPAGPQPCLVFVMTLPGAVLGEVAQSMALLQVAGHSEKQVDQLVFDTIEGLRQSRSESLSGGSGQREVTSGSGLILPS